MLSSAQPAPTGDGQESLSMGNQDQLMMVIGIIDGASSETLTPTALVHPLLSNKRVISTLNGVNCSVYSNIVTLQLVHQLYLHRLTLIMAITHCMCIRHW